MFLGTAVALAGLSYACASALRWRYLDVWVPAAALGGSVVRVGCFLGHHHAGRLTTMPLSVAYPGGARYDLGL
jgi:prolipoprotein diacylglyceryltransferase